MSFRFVVALAGVALVAGAVAHAGPTFRSPTIPGFQTLKISDVVDTRQQYIDRAKTDMENWENRMWQLNADAQARGAELGVDAQRNLNKSWAVLKADWRRLRAARDDAWGKAQISFDRAARDMKTRWQSMTTSSASN